MQGGFTFAKIFRREGNPLCDASFGRVCDMGKSFYVLALFIFVKIHFMKEDFVYEDQTVERPGNGIEA
jgi:hypothetical protein